MLQEKTSPSPSASVFSSTEMIFPPSTPTTKSIIVKPTPLSVSTTSSWSSSTSSAYMLSPSAKPPSPPKYFPSSSSAFQPASQIKTKIFADPDPASTQISSLTTSQLKNSTESDRSITPITELVSNPENASKLREAIQLLQASYHGVIAELERQTKEAQSLHESYVQVVHHNKKLHLVCNAVGPAAEKLQKMVDKLLPHVRNSQNPLLLSSSSSEEIPRTKSISVNDSAQSSLMAALISPTKRNVRGKLSAKFVQQARQRSFNNANSGANSARPAKDVRFNSIPLHLHKRDIHGVTRAETQALLDSPRRKILKINPEREFAESKSNHKRSPSIDSNISDASTVTLDEAEINAQRDLHPHTTDGSVVGLKVSREARTSIDNFTSVSTPFRAQNFNDETISAISEDKRINVVASGRLRKITHLHVVTTSTPHTEQLTISFVYLCGLSSSSSPGYDPATPTVTVLVYDINVPNCLLLHSSSSIQLPKLSSASALKTRKRSCSMMEEADAKIFSEVQTLTGTIGEYGEMTVILKFENGVTEKRVCNAEPVNGDHT
ncbi:hypothetical protein BKA69DRAFT_1038765 [Paraphysoderma sedebokerense]|nr:hypothetical protein BKA69DRAFT_1038765 [Paraphysoderma sedebokerense]